MRTTLTLDDDVAAKLNAESSFVTILLYPEPVEETTSLVSIPVAHVLRHKEHSQRMMKGMEIEVEPGA